MTDQPFTPATFAAEPADPYSPSTLPFRFTGTASEYFRIWIVNALLSLVTLGVYSAWAKVRTKRYFYRHTWVGDASFDYLGNPVAILKGRVLMVAVLVAVGLAEQYSMPLYFILVVGLVLATPWVIVQSLRFNARNSSYRNVRFSFRGTVEQSYIAYVVGGLAYLASCGLCFPYLQWRVSQFAVNGHTFGTAPFRFRTEVGDFFIAFLVAIAITMPLFGVFMGGMVVSGIAMAGEGEPANPDAINGVVMVLLPLFYASLLVPGAYLKARLANLFWGGIDIGPHSLESTQAFKGVLHLQVTNVLAIVFTLGLAIPWAMVRSHRYLIEHLTLHTAGPLDVEAVAGPGRDSAFGDAATDLGDFGLDLG